MYIIISVVNKGAVRMESELVRASWLEQSNVWDQFDVEDFKHTGRRLMFHGKIFGWVGLHNRGLWLGLTFQ